MEKYKKIIQIGTAITSSIGVIVTSYLASKAALKANERISAQTGNLRTISYNGTTQKVYLTETDKEDSPHEITLEEKIKMCWKYYIPTVVSAGATIGIITLGTTIGIKEQTALLGALAVVQENYAKYKETNIKENGINAHKKVMDSIISEKAVRANVGAGTEEWADDCSDNAEELLFCYEGHLGDPKYFKSTKEDVLKAEYHLNRNMILGLFVNEQMFLDFLGIKNQKGSKIHGWGVCDSYYWIDFNHYITERNGLKVYVIEPIFEPEKEDYLCG